MLVVSVSLGGVIDALLGASGLDLLDIVTKGKGLAVDVMGALLHGVVVASVGGAEVTSSDDTGVFEPFPGGSNLATIAAEGLALKGTATGGGIRDGEESLESTLGGNADSVVKSLGGTVSPA